jgi:hypothetical protein
MRRPLTQGHADQLELGLPVGRCLVTPLSRAMSQRYRRVEAPAPRPWQCVILAVDTARQSGWASYVRGRLQRFGEVDTLDAGKLAVLASQAVTLGAEQELPVVLVLETPFGGSVGVVSALGQARERWLVAWHGARQSRGRVVLVLPGVWRGPVLGRHAVRLERELVRQLELQTASALVLEQQGKQWLSLGHDEAAAILIGRWAAHAGAVGRVIGKRAVRASLKAWGNYAGK